jgi:hypothetical protein
MIFWKYLSLSVLFLISDYVQSFVSTLCAEAFLSRIKSRVSDSFIKQTTKVASKPNKLRRNFNLVEPELG